MCDEPLLGGNRIATIPGAGEPGPDGFVAFRNVNDSGIFITFPNPPTELSTIKVKRPADSLPGDDVTVSTAYTDEDGKEQSKVTFEEYIFLQIYHSKGTALVHFTCHSIFSTTRRK